MGGNEREEDPRIVGTRGRTDRRHPRHHIPDEVPAPPPNSAASTNTAPPSPPLSAFLDLSSLSLSPLLCLPHPGGLYVTDAAADSTTARTRCDPKNRRRARDRTPQNRQRHRRRIWRLGQKHGRRVGGPRRGERRDKQRRRETARRQRRHR